MKKSPLISVVMSAYNEEAYIEKAIRSILTQTEPDFELIIFDDCSTDATTDIIENIKDERIRLYKNEKNCGLTRNLNQGLRLAKGKYIARMDGDDISLQKRFEKQVRYLEEHPGVMLISCQTQNFGESSLCWKLRESSEELKVRMLVRPVFAHPGFMMKRELLDKDFFYDETFRTAQDYEFASRVAGKYEIGIVPEVLLYYRVHKKQVSNLSGKEQFGNADRVREKLWTQAGVKLSESEKKALQRWAREDCAGNMAEYVEMNRLIDKMLAANKSSKIYQQDILGRTLDRMMYIWVIRSKKAGYLLCFPKVCRYRWKNMVLFVQELLTTAKEKISNQGKGDIIPNVEKNEV